MNRHQHLMTIAMEEAAELAQRLSKAKRFGLREIESGQPHTNFERVYQEFADLIAVMEMAGWHHRAITEDAITAKAEKVEKYLEYSRQQGTLIG